MSNLNIFIEEIENRKKREISLLDNNLNERKTDFERTKELSSKEIMTKYENEASIKSQREGAKIVESARLKSKKILFDTINSNMDSTFKIIIQELQNYATGNEYKTTIKKMITYAKEKLGDDLIIHCRQEDNAFLKKMNLNLGSSIQTMGGIIAENKTGTKELDLTFEELLRSKEDDIKSFLLEKMMN